MISKHGFQFLRIRFPLFRALEGMPFVARFYYKGRVVSYDRIAVFRRNIRTLS